MSICIVFTYIGTDDFLYTYMQDRIWYRITNLEKKTEQRGQEQPGNDLLRSQGTSEIFAAHWNLEQTTLVTNKYYSQVQQMLHSSVSF